MKVQKCGTAQYIQKYNSLLFWNLLFDVAEITEWNLLNWLATEKETECNLFVSRALQ